MGRGKTLLSFRVCCVPGTWLGLDLSSPMDSLPGLDDSEGVIQVEC